MTRQDKLIRKSPSLTKLRQRRAAERRFHLLAQFSVIIGALALSTILVSIFSKGYTAFVRTVVELEVFFDPEVMQLSKEPSKREIEEADFYSVALHSLFTEFPEVTDGRAKRELKQVLSFGAAQELRERVLQNPSLIGSTRVVRLTVASDFDQMHKGRVPRNVGSEHRILSDQQLRWFDSLQERGQIHTEFNTAFFLQGDSRYPELAGVGGAIVGSFLTLLLCLTLAFPIGVATAIYLEEFAPKNSWTDLIEVNINNLAAVPSIIFGLLGLGIVLNVFGVPRGTPIVGGIILALMTLPTIIIAARASLRAVPPSIREGALAMGASPVQVVLHHVLPLALPGTLTGTIIGLAQALGETAPLLMIGMVAFIADIPEGFSDAAAVLPVQIYLWAESAERGFVEKTSAAIMIILVFLMLMNASAVLLRQKFERRS